MTITTMNTQSILSHHGESIGKVRARRDIHRGSVGVGSSPSMTMLMKVPYGPPSQLVVFFTLLCANLAVAHAHPLDDSQNNVTENKLHRLFPRDTSKNTIIPIAVVAAVALFLGIFIIWRCHKACLSFLRRCREHVGDPEAVNYSTEPRELTAEQLAGSINGPGYTPRTRRGRRTRRTPSQISTHSLPVYAKEPGEQEIVVILQGPAGMQEAQTPQPLATVVDLGEEAEAETRTVDAQRLQYSPMPDSSPNSPLLDQHAAPDVLAPNLRSISHRHSGSTGTGSDSADTSSLAQIESTDHNNPASTTDRGEAPPYFEVVDANHSIRRDIASAGPNNASTTSTPGATNSPPSSPTRRAGLRSLLNRVSGSAVSHVRNSSSLSGVSFHSHSRSHGRGPSVASVLRPLSRPRSSASHNGSRPNLSSPSMISLNSISAPLTHTAVRTEFTYPRGGLTADQMRMISSRDSLVRFGVPYGPDAIAFASLSRENLVLGEMPPEFEEAATPGSGNNGDTNSNLAAGISDREDGENAHVQEATTSNGDNQDTATGGSTASHADGLPAEQVTAEITVEGLPAINGVRKENGTQERLEEGERLVQSIDNSEQEAQSRLDPNPTTPDHSTAENSVDRGKVPDIVADKQSQLDHGPEQEAQASSHVDSTTSHEALSKATSDPTSSPEVRTAHSIVEGSITAEVQPPTPLSSPTATQSVTPSRALIDELPSDAPRSAKPLAPPPPSSFHPVSSQDSRPESRISQISYASDATFRTAAESLSSRWRINTSDDEDDDEDDGGHATWERERSPTPTSGGKDTSGHGEETLDNVTNSTNESRTSSLNRAKHMSSATIRGP